MELSSTAPMAVAPPDRPGKSAQAVGQIAKAAVAEARSAGIDIPKNAQGHAASRIAQGADPASIFAAKVEHPDVNGDATTDAVDTGTGEAETAPVTAGQVSSDATGTDRVPSGDAVTTATTAYDTANSQIGLAAKDGAEIALDLLVGENRT